MSTCWHGLTSSVGNALSIPQSQALFHSLSYHYSSRATSISILRVPSCSATGLRDVFIHPLEPKSSSIQQFTQVKQSKEKSHGGKIQQHDVDEDEDEEVGISKMQVPRQKYIPVSKSELLDAIISTMFKSEDLDDVQHFRLLATCLDSILHAEHKRILEEMRSDFQVSNSVESEDLIPPNSADLEMKHVENGNDSDAISNGSVLGIADSKAYQDMVAEAELQKPIFNSGLDLRSLLRSLEKNSKKDSNTWSRVTVATRFQRAFMQLLSDAQFEELSARDLMLTSALNTDYLLTLPIYIDWKRAYESNAIIFRRGYATEKQKGLLIVEKLDYLQSKLLRRIFFIISKPLKKLGTWINELYKNASQKQEVQRWTERLKLWLNEVSVFKKSLLYNESASDGQAGVNQLNDGELPIGLAAQRAVARYEGILSPVGPRERLLRRLLSWIGLIPPSPETPFEVDNDTNALEPYLRPTFLSWISLSDIWRPATRKYCGNNPWKMLKTSISILFSESVLQEPAFKELILLYTKEVSERDAKDKAEVPELQLKIYERIPIPDLPVIFPHKKLSFRIIDTVRLDVASILGLLAYFINYKFENVLSSPSAIFLDVVAASALIIYASRVVLGYKQTWDRYQLLVNKTLYEKTLASGFGSVHFLLDASEQQQYKEAILAYAILLKVEKGQVNCRQSVGDKCERFMYQAFKVKVEMPIDKAINTLLRLSLATETVIDGRHHLLATPCPMAYEALQQRWNSLLT